MAQVCCYAVVCLCRPLRLHSGQGSGRAQECGGKRGARKLVPCDCSTALITSPANIQELQQSPVTLRHLQPISPNRPARTAPAMADAEDFQHVELEPDAGDELPAAPASQQKKQGAPAAAVAAAGPETAGMAAAGAQEADEAARKPGAAAPAAAAAAPAAAPLPSSPPPATAALASVLGFFSSVTGSNAATPSADEAAQPTKDGATAATTGVDKAAAAGAEDEAAEEADAVASFEAEVAEAAEKLQHGVEEVRDSGRGAASDAPPPQPTLNRTAAPSPGRWAKSCCTVPSRPRRAWRALRRASAAGSASSTP